MTTSRFKQNGFAMPAMFLAVAIAFLASLNVKTKHGTTIAQEMGLGSGKQAEFAAVEQQDGDQLSVGEQANEMDER